MRFHLYQMTHAVLTKEKEKKRLLKEQALGC